MASTITTNTFFNITDFSGTEVIRGLAGAQGVQGRKTKIEYLNPKALSPKELYGYITSATREWRDGMLSDILRSLGLIPNEEPKWIALDGDLVRMLFFFTLCHSLSLFVTLCHSLSLFVTLCHSLSLFFIDNTFFFTVHLLTSIFFLLFQGHDLDRIHEQCDGHEQNIDLGLQ